MATTEQTVTERLLEITKRLLSLLDRVAVITTEHAEQRATLQYVREELARVRSSIAKIGHILLEGNGDPPILTRVAVLESKLVQLGEEVDNYTAASAELERFNKENAKISKAGKWALAAAIVTAIGALGVAVISLLS